MLPYPKERNGMNPEQLQVVDNVLADTSTDKPTRSAILKRAAIGTAIAAGAGAFVNVKGAAAAGDSIETIVNTAITAEQLAVTYLTGVIENVKDPSVTKFGTVLKAANASEYAHYEALKSLGAKPLTSKFWAPDAVFEPKSVFPTIEFAESMFVNAYLVGITTFAEAGNSTLARYAGEILGTEAQHLALAKFAQGMLPDDRAFQSFIFSSVGGIVGRIEKQGIGFGKRVGSGPGKFYAFPGKPPAAAVVKVRDTVPAFPR
jgi:hypothetical protein